MKDFWCIAAEYVYTMKSSKSLHAKVLPVNRGEEKTAEFQQLRRPRAIGIEDLLAIYRSWVNGTCAVAL